MGVFECLLILSDVAWQATTIAKSRITSRDLSDMRSCGFSAEIVGRQDNDPRRWLLVQSAASTQWRRSMSERR
jgi:hypothetical protein